jgi:diguanylate cyclase (GGDEF)-like protein/PAS domain S-box-containing protein
MLPETICNSQLAAFCETLLERLHDGVYVLDPDRKIVYWNRAAEEISGFSAREIVGSSCAGNFLNHIGETGEQLCHGMCPVAATLRDGRARQAHVCLHHKEGHRLPVDVRVEAIRDPEGKIIGAFEVFSLGCGARVLETPDAAYRQQLLSDNLTGLASRHRGESRLAGELSLMGYNDWGVGAMVVNLDRFNNVGALFGRQAADRVLIMVANTLIHGVRPSDLVARMIDDMFLIVLPNVDLASLTNEARRICRLVEASFLVVPQGKIQVTASVGAALARQDDTALTLVARAETLMRESKAGGGNFATVHDGSQAAAM